MKKHYVSTFILLIFSGLFFSGCSNIGRIDGFIPDEFYRSYSPERGFPNINRVPQQRDSRLKILAERATSPDNSEEELRKNQKNLLMRQPPALREYNDPKWPLDDPE